MAKAIRFILLLAFILVGVGTFGVGKASAQPLNYGVSCTAEARLMDDWVMGGGMSMMRVKHIVSCNQVVGKIVVYATDYKEGYQTVSTVHTTLTCTNESVCVIFDLSVPTQSYSSANGWYITRTSADVGVSGNSRYYGSVPEVRQHQFWCYTGC